MKKIFRILFTITFICSLIGCTWQAPQKVSISTNATYNFCLGNVEKDFSDYFSVSSILTGAFSSNGNVKVYDYYPEHKDGKIQKYLMKMPIQDIPIDFSSYFNDTAIAGSVKGMSFESKLSVPELPLSHEEKIDVDMVASAINALVVDSGSSHNGEQLLTFDGNFESVTYGDKAKMIVNCEPKTAFGSVTFWYNGKEIATSYLMGGLAEFDVSKATIYKSGMSLVFSANVDSYAVRMDASNEVVSAKGVTIPAPVIIPVNATIPGSKSPSFTECTIGTGNLTISLDMPSSWSGIDVNYDVGLTGAITTLAPASSETEKVLPLNDQVLGNGDINVKSSMSFTFTNASIDFTKSINLKTSAKIEEFKKIGLILTGVKTDIDVKEAISQEMKQMITALVLEPSGLKGTFKNTLPEGNDIIIKASSSFIGLEESKNTQVLEGGTTEETSIDKLMSDIPTKTVKFTDNPSAADEFDKMDFKVHIELPGADATNPNKVVVENVKPNTEYEVAINLDPAINWTKVSINTAGLSPIPGTIPTGLNLSQIFNSFTSTLGGNFAGNIGIKSMKIHLFTVKPDLDAFNEAEFTGSLKMFYSEDGVTDKYPSASIDFMKNGKLKFVDMPKLEFDKENPEVLVSDISSFTSSAEAEMQPLLDASSNDANGCIYVSYNLGFSNGNGSKAFDITKKDFENSGTTNPSIAVYAFVEIPLMFETKDNINISLLQLAGMNTGDDLLNRSEPTDLSKIEDVTKAIRSFDINFNSAVMPFYATGTDPNNPDMMIKFNWDPTGTYNVDPTNVKLEKGTLSLTDFVDIIGIYPLTPDINIFIPKGTLSVPREMGINMNISLQLAIDPDYKINIGGGN